MVSVILGSSYNIGYQLILSLVVITLPRRLRICLSWLVCLLVSRIKLNLQNGWPWNLVERCGIGQLETQERVETHCSSLRSMIGTERWLSVSHIILNVSHLYCIYRIYASTYIFFSLTDISQHTRRGLGDWQDVYQWSASGHDKHLQTRQDPKAAPPHDPDQLGNGESTEPEIWPQTVRPEAQTQVTPFYLHLSLWHMNLGFMSYIFLCHCLFFDQSPSAFFIFERKTCLSFHHFHRILDRGVVINDVLPCQILQGAIVLKPNLKAFVETGVVFEDGTVEKNIDAVVFCTGYNGTFPFLPPALSEGTHGELTLYK